jgi:AcrR family transcriptional regulator
MRIKDENKEEAIFEATIRLINEIGFANISMSKIAKVAGVSNSTLYVYFNNKEDMFKKVYLGVKKQMLSACKKNISIDEPVRQTIGKICANLLKFAKDHVEYFLFIEQSANSPLIASMPHDEIDSLLSGLLSVFEKGIQEGILKKASPVLLLGFCYYPITQLYKEQCLPGSSLGDMDFELVLQMCWDAIKA